MRVTRELERLIDWLYRKLYRISEGADEEDDIFINDNRVTIEESSPDEDEDEDD